ncbi:response regulator [Aureliella helgolandensis]|uniref:Alkaline phosphatase synthesis transcriptional regulatory protein PhoP n=1 Tax=Aureliella helgolandensis TaxID=2527968 RepID=A0A518G989_9BACT|nr:response regulator [Aureliella helgolandensis]QDV25168.1 Alkaline phosphatase synthesis transcriptional regulatory protein PhoP [Aureliella helgolandensis]
MPSSRRILIVEDDEAIRFATVLRLRQQGYQTFTASDGEAGLKAALTLRPDMILMDIRMPKLDGLAALRELKGNPETLHIPVVIVSASPGDQSNALDSGAEYFVRKPYSHELLTQVLASAFAAPTLGR